MNRTQQLTRNWLQQSGLADDAILLEALLRRGFLAYRDGQGLWLGTGSHPQDIDVLRLVDGLRVESLPVHMDRMARVILKSPDIPVMGVAIAIVAILENHDDGHSLWTGYGIPDYLGSGGWNSYRKMAWGTKLAICPTSETRGSAARNALDLGVGLLVKAFPLARVATRVSCDGHGIKPAWISFHTDWDSLWAKAVFDVLEGTPPNSKWDWNHDLHVSPLGGFGDAEILAMLSDIQVFSRRLLHQTTIDKIGLARAKTLETFGQSPPLAESFGEEAKHQLSKEFIKARC